MSDDCGSCRFFKMRVIGDGMCRRYPQAVPKSPKDWCGEFSPGTLHVAPKPKEEPVEKPVPKKGKAK